MKLKHRSISDNKVIINDAESAWISNVSYLSSKLMKIADHLIFSQTPFENSLSLPEVSQAVTSKHHSPEARL